MSISFLDIEQDSQDIEDELQAYGKLHDQYQSCVENPLVNDGRETYSDIVSSSSFNLIASLDSSNEFVILKHRILLYSILDYKDNITIGMFIFRLPKSDGSISPFTVNQIYGILSRKRSFQLQQTMSNAEFEHWVELTMGLTC